MWPAQRAVGAERLPEAHWFDSAESLLADTRLDFVDICTPPNLHTSMIVDAMQAGKHVICEQPFAGYFGREDDKVPIGNPLETTVFFSHLIFEGTLDRFPGLKICAAHGGGYLGGGDPLPLLAQGR